MEDMEEYLPPQSIAAEQGVIGGLLLDISAWTSIQGIVNDADFYKPEHSVIFLAIGYLLSKEQPVDILTLSEILKKRNRLEGIGGLAYLGWLTKNTPSAANIRTYAEIVREKSIKRQLIAFSRKMIDDCMAGEEGAKKLLANAETDIFRLNQISLKGKKGFVSIRDSLSRVVDRIEANYDSKPTTGTLGLPSGFGDLDALTSGFCGGQFWIVAARPAMGKSVFGVNIAQAAALTDRPVAIFSLEMTHDELAERMLSGVSGVELKKLRQSWELEESHWPRITAGTKRLFDLPLYIDDTPGATANDIRAKCMRLNAEVSKEYPKGLGMIVIDYLQLMGNDTSGYGNRNNEIEEITRNLKRMAKEFDIPIIALAQLNRGLESRPNKRPILSDLRDSGSIEQDADGVIFLYRDEVYNKDSQDKGIAEIIISKQRHGSLGTVRLFFDGPCTSFRNRDNNYPVAYRAEDYE